MSNNDRAAKLWWVNVMAFVLLVVLVITGLINWLVLPPGGYRGGENALAAARHFMRGVHQWTSLLFIIVMAVHWALHWKYIRSNLQRHGFFK